jgi:hypothetical protein
VCEKNQAFLVPSGPDKHLYVVITEADDSGMHILANITSIDPDIPHDKSCCLTAGEHAFVKHDSYVAYEFAMQRQGAHIDKQVQIGSYIQKEDASDALVEKIRVGLKITVCQTRHQRRLRRGREGRGAAQKAAK